MNRILKFRFANYQQTIQASIQNPSRYWQQEAKHVRWNQFPQKIQQVQKQHHFRWFPDGKMNITDQCVDRNAEERPDQVAYYYQSPITEKKSQITYRELHRRVSHFAGSLSTQFKVKKGDRVIIYMPMVIESIIATLACARIGAIHVIVFGGFAAKELANRIGDCDPTLLICGNAGKQPNKTIDYLKIVEEALQLSKSNIPSIIFSRENLIASRPLKANQYDFLEVQRSGTSMSPVILPATHPLYILYTSGTTGNPKGIVRDHGGNAVSLSHACRKIYNAVPGEGMFCSSDIGWVLGTSFIIYAPLLLGLRSVLFEGKPVGTPDASVFWEILSRHKIQHLYTSPTAIRTIRKEDPNGDHIKNSKLDALRNLIFVGERCDVSTFNWIFEKFPKQTVIDTYWQTETGSPILSSQLSLGQKFPIKPGSSGKPVPGYNVKIINPETNLECQPGKTGLISIKNPMPPAFMQTLYKNDQQYISKYFSEIPGYYHTGDSGFMDEDGQFYVMSRVDDVINCAGHRLSTGEMEEAIMHHKDIAEAIVVGINDDIKGEVPVGFVTIKSQVKNLDEPKIQKELIALIREYIGPVASFKVVHVVPRLPKTRSGKYLRNVVKKMCNRQKYQIPSTVEDVEVIHEIDALISGFKL